MNLLPSGRRERRGSGALASGAVLLAVIASLMGQPGSAAAAAPPVAPQSAAAASSQPGATSGPTAGTATAAPSAAASTPPSASESRPAKVAPKTAPTTEAKSARGEAVRAVQQSAPPGPCPATLAPQTVVGCAVGAYQTASFSITLPQQTDLVLIQAVAAQGTLYPTMVAPDGSTKVTCDSPFGSGYGYGVLRCPTSQAGTYSLQVKDGSGTQNGISVSYLPLLSATGCKTVAATDRTLGAPTVFPGSLPVASAGDCYTLDLAANDVLRSYANTYRVTQTVYDATGKQVCTDQSNPGNGLDCRLAGTAPFRVTVQQSSGAAQDYSYSAARLSQPEGCTVVEPQAFGTTPDLSGTARCRTLRVPQATHYGFGPVSTGTAPSGGLFTPDGTALVANCSLGACDLTPGDYTWAVQASNTTAGAFGMFLYSATENRGCVATGDEDLANGPATGTFAGPGEQLCLALPTATGNGLYLLNQPPSGGADVAVEIDDAGGAKQCTNGGYAYGVCKLTGTAPFRAVLSGTPGKAYQLAIQRTGDSAGCTAWPQSGFDGSWGAQVSLTATVPQACLSLPADQHASAEMLDFANSKNQLNASVHVVDPSGTEVCQTVGTSYTACQLAAGVPYTAMLVGVGGADTYKVVHRDISPTAQCTTPASTAVGGPSTPYDLNSVLDARCIRISGAATDKFWLSARTLGSRYDPGTVMSVVDANGKPVCTQWGTACKVTGSTSYVAFVLASGYNGTTIHTNVDTWKVGSAAGWAPECTANPVSVDGFALRSGVLNESSTGYCAVLDMKPNQSFNVYGTDSSTSLETPLLTLTGSSSWDDPNLTYQCVSMYGTFGANCQATPNSVAGQAVLLLSANQAATPVEYSMQGVCNQGCTRAPQPTPTGLSPATGTAGTQHQAVLQGTGLTLGTKAWLAQNGGKQTVLTPLSVSADGTSLDVLVDTNGLVPGSYDLALDTVGYTTGTPSYGYLPNAYTVTAAATTAKDKFVPITPTRFLDTRYGIGAPKAQLGWDGVVALQVAGQNGVPSTGVNAVVMNVTAVNPSDAGHVTVYPDGQPAPNTSNLNFTAGDTVPNLVTVPVLNGKVDLKNASSSVDLIADVTGYFTDSGAGSAFTPITPTRFLDTRYGIGAPQAPVGPGGVASLQVAGVNGVPATGVTAVVMNVTAVYPTEAGHVTVYPDGQPLPDVSNLNFTAGQIVPNLVTVPVVNGMVDLRNNSGSVDLIADVTGYYSATGSTYSSVAPVRLLDTRVGTGARQGKVSGDSIVSLQVGGVEGVPATGVTAVVLNVTVTEPTDDSHMTVYPHGIACPNASNLNFTAGQTRANLVVVPVVDGRVTFYNHAGDTHVIADLEGYFTS
ncbi:hypothetical protein [Kitasatospora sp. NBC_01266]|uniref:hypothetical protein n=1 Tax=Kitasatospora sp. NBC_01266 TaxID=2903572 RepID=UPI002E32AE81|nr:hypothetical protein [Kitasatospora sp. NBC_01266]